MTNEERLARARKSLGRAISRKDSGDVSEEISSLIANLTAARAPFGALETGEHEVLAILGQGFFSAMRRIAARPNLVPRPNKLTRDDLVGNLIRRTEEVYGLIAVKMDADAADFIEENDPFLIAMRDEDGMRQSSHDLTEMLRSVDIEALFSNQQDADTDDDPVLEVGEVELNPVERILVQVIDIVVVEPARLGDGISDIEVELRWFARTG